MRAVVAASPIDSAKTVQAHATDAITLDTLHKS